MYLMGEHRTVQQTTRNWERAKEYVVLLFSMSMHITKTALLICEVRRGELPLHHFP